MRKVVLGLLMSMCVAVQADSFILLKAGALLNVEDGSLLENPTVLIEDSLIVAINPDEVPEDAVVVDLPGMTLLPGFMDAHVHLTISDSHFVPLILTENTASAALRAAQSARETLLGGFTTVRDLGQLTPSLDLVTVSLSHAIQKGQVIGPDVIAAGHTIGISGGHADLTMGYAEGRFELDWRYGVSNGTDEMVKATRYQIKHGARVIKIAATAGVLSLEASVGAQQMTDAELRAVVEEAGRHDIKVAAHAHGTEGIKSAIRAGVASIEHGSLIDREGMAMMKKHGTYLVPTSGLLDTIDLTGMPSVIKDKASYVLPLAAENLREAIKYGVPIALGTDAPLVPHGENAYEFVVMVKRGMSPLQAIQAGTINTADLFSLPDRGRIKVGLRADIVAVPGNPLEDISVLQHVGFVMKAGVVYKQP